MIVIKYIQVLFYTYKLFWLNKESVGDLKGTISLFDVVRTCYHYNLKIIKPIFYSFI